MHTISEQLVDLAMAIRFKDLPDEVVREAGRRVLDAFACMVAGATGTTSQQVRKTIMALEGKQESSILGTAHFSSCEKATLINCTSLRFLDYMDGYLGPYPCHACFNIPPIVAIAERTNTIGEQFITAIVIAYEIMARFMECAGLPSLAGRGWAGATNLEFSVPLAIAPLIGLDREQTVNALAISISHGNVLNASSHGQMASSKSIIDGMTAMSAVVASLLAQQGLKGPREVVEGSGGYVSAVAGTCNYDTLLAPVERYRILDISTKWHNTTKRARTPVAAALQLVKESRLNWRDIAALQIGLAERDWYRETHDLAASRTRPQTRDAANHSIWFSVAAAVVEGQLGPDQFEPEMLQSQDILNLIDRMSIYWEKAHDEYWPSANPATIKIRITDGQELSKTLLFAPGHPSNPLPDEALEEKFRQLTHKVLAPWQIDGAITATHQLADLPNIRSLTELVRPNAHS